MLLLNIVCFTRIFKLLLFLIEEKMKRGKLRTCLKDHFLISVTELDLTKDKEHGPHDVCLGGGLVPWM